VSQAVRPPLVQLVVGSRSITERARKRKEEEKKREEEEEEKG
jgi:hypothetical protein